MATVAEIFETMEYGPAPESDAPARRWLAQHERTFGHFIGGAWTEPGQDVRRHRPVDGQAHREGDAGQRKDVDAAVAAARKALPGVEAL